MTETIELASHWLPEDHVAEIAGPIETHLASF